jgi:hypothetical protein
LLTKETKETKETKSAKNIMERLEQSYIDVCGLREVN